MGFGFGFGMIFMVLFWVAIIGLIAWGVSAAARGGTQSSKGESLSPLDIAGQRYARGEISRQEFEQLKKDLKAG